MRSRSGLLGLLMVLVALSLGCSMKQPPVAPQPVSTAPAPAQTQQSFDSHETTYAPGADVKLSSGLKVRVPNGWGAALTRPAGESTTIPGPFDSRPAATEVLTLFWLSGATPYTQVIVTSYPDTASTSASTASRWPHVYSAGDVVLSAESTDTSLLRLHLAVTHLPGKAVGQVVFNGTGPDYPALLAQAWRFFDIRGASIRP